MTRRARAVATAATAALAACSGFDQKGPARPAGPAGLTAVLEAPECTSGCSQDALEVTWTPAAYKPYVPGAIGRWGALGSAAVTAPWDTAGGVRSLAVDPAGAPGALFRSGIDTFSLVRRGPDGWTGSSLPVPSGRALTPLRLHLPSADGAVVVAGTYGTPYECWLLERDASRWQEPAQVPLTVTT